MYHLQLFLYTQGLYSCKILLRYVQVCLIIPMSHRKTVQKYICFYFILGNIWSFIYIIYKHIIYCLAAENILCRLELTVCEKQQNKSRCTWFNYHLIFLSGYNILAVNVLKSKSVPYKCFLLVVILNGKISIYVLILALRLSFKQSLREWMDCGWWFSSGHFLCVCVCFPVQKSWRWQSRPCFHTPS